MINGEPGETTTLGPVVAARTVVAVIIVPATIVPVENRDDIRQHSETDLNFRLTQMISLSNSVLVDFDSDPVPGHRHTYVQSSISLSISIYKGSRPQ